MVVPPQDVPARPGVDGLHSVLRTFLVAIACNVGMAGGQALGATYHVDSQGGSDQASGLSPEQAWRTLSRVNAMRLNSGDSVLLKRGGLWTGQLEISSSGGPGAPITVGAYGVGARPVLERGARGIISENQRHIDIRDLHIRNTGLGGAWVKGGTAWRFQNVVVERTGLQKSEGGIAWWHGKDLIVTGSIFKDVTGDGIWAWQAEGVRLLNNQVGVVQGPNSDNVHVTHARNFEIRGNILSMDGPTNSGKGNMLLANSDGGVVANNTFIAGNFGIGIDASNTVVEANHFINHNSASWSAALNMGSGRSQNLVVRNNYFDGARVGLSLFELKGKWADAPVVRANMTVANNIFNVTQHALTVNGPVQYSGAFTGNTIIGARARDWNRPGGTVLGGGWNETGTSFAAVAPRWTGGAPCHAVGGSGGVKVGTAKTAAPSRSGDTSGAMAACPRM
jgi:Right handed beta helix region